MKIKNSNLVLLILLYTLSLFTICAQENEQTIGSIEEGTLEAKFDFINKVSSNYKEGIRRFEVVNVVYLESLKTQVTDSIESLESKIDKANATINNQLNSINLLNEEIKQANTTIKNINSEKDTIALFGLHINKVFYNLLLWSIILILIILLFIFIFKFRSSNSFFRDAKNKLSELELEYEEHRRRALEREQKVKRQLIDVVNKQKKANP